MTLGIQFIELVPDFCPDCQLLALDFARARTKDGPQYWCFMLDMAHQVGHIVFHDAVMIEAHKRRFVIPDSWKRRNVFYRICAGHIQYLVYARRGGFET